MRKNSEVTKGYIKLKKDPVSERFHQENIIIKGEILRQCDWTIGFIICNSNIDYKSMTKTFRKRDNLANIANVLNLCLFLQIVIFSLVFFY